MRLMAALALLVLATAADAGVAVDMVTTDTSGGETERTQIYAQDGLLRLDSNGGPFSSDVSMIFDGTGFLVIDHDETTYIIMDEAMLNQMTAKMSEAIEQLKAQLDSMPPEQRAMAEQMMQGQMQAMMGGEPVPAPRVEATGEDEFQGRACTRFDVFEGDIRTQNICAAPLDQINGAAEMMDTFQGMARFVKKLSESLPGPLGSSFNQNPGMVMELIGGFPIHTVEYSMGKRANEVFMETIAEEALDPAIFEVPEGYTLEDPFAER